MMNVIVKNIPINIFMTFNEFINKDNNKDIFILNYFRF